MENKFRPRARIMKTLGEELISNDSVAIIELVKNSYDADAANVLIRFSAPLQRGMGKIEVIDDGVGMSIDTIRRAWMEPATPTKSIKRESDAGRKVLGEKGIGRFAASRLAFKSEVISRRAEEPSEAYAYVDWSQFDDEEKYLDEVEIFSEVREPQELYEHGTVLRLTELKTDWSVSDFLQLQRALSRLISPFSMVDDFHIKVEAPEGFERFTSEISPPEVIKYPHYVVSGSVDADGVFEIVYSVEASGYKEKVSGRLVLNTNGWNMIDRELLDNVEGEGRAPECGPFKIELRVWDRDDLGNVVQVTNSSISNVRKDLDAYAGINIYRDGFRVLPYGERGNDWLRLDLRRVQSPSLRVSNNQVLGYVAIEAAQNPNLKDQSNREGLRENQAFSDLAEIMICILSRMEVIRKRAKNKHRGREKNEFSPDAQGIFTLPDFSNISAHLNSRHPQDRVAKELLGKVEEDLTKQLDSIKTVVARYQGLVTLGQLIDTVLHNGRQPLSKIAGDSTLAKEEIESAPNEFHKSALLKSVHLRLTRIQMQSEVLHGVFKRVEPFGGRKRGRPAQLYLEKIISDSFEIFSSQILNLNVKVTLPATQTLVTVDSAELQEVFVNLIQNSLYWLANVDKSTRAIIVTVKRTAENHVEMIFADSGPGIDPRNRDHIFEPYFSTRNEGTGLGLSVSGEIIRDYYGGALELMDSSDAGGAAFKITLKKRV